ncbi:hypothetical protein PoB_005155400 [Plakobranchus ocellatus]|uniref:Uncharacterized protein n=1 Tax=Plakobranchus ocellatus TaxID=259542 RepID=A0AAV4C301_9GAST|nr:hypothetical protein PoB_005155400 [Plakobranchus ocellatus]
MLQDKFDPVEKASTTTQNPQDQNFDLELDSGLADVQLRPGSGHGGTVEDESLTDVVAALVSAILALTFLILVFCLIQIIKKRRRQQQGQRLDQPIVHTISTGAFTASAAAYSQHIPTASHVSWERVDTRARPDRTPPQRGLRRLNPAQFSSHLTDLQLPGRSNASLSEALSLSSLSSEVAHSHRHSSSESLQASASPAVLFPHVMQVDTMLHHFPPSPGGKLKTSENYSSHIRSWSDGKFPSLPPPLFGSAFQQQEVSAASEDVTLDLLETDVHGAAGGTDNSCIVRTLDSCRT